MTTYAEDFIKGSHDFKFGVEFEQSHSRNLYRYTGANHRIITTVWYAYYGYYGNYSAVQYEGYNAKMKLNRLEGFVQDSWQVTKRLNLSLGVRLSQNWGSVPTVAGTPLQRVPGRPAARLHLRHPRRQDDHPQGPLRRVHGRDLCRHGRPPEHGLVGQDHLDLDPFGPAGRDWWYEYNRDIQGTWVDRPRAQASVHEAVHHRRRAGAVQGHFVLGHLHQPDLPQFPGNLERRCDL